MQAMEIHDAETNRSGDADRPREFEHVRDLLCHDPDAVLCDEAGDQRLVATRNGDK